MVDMELVMKNDEEVQMTTFWAKELDHFEVLKIKILYLVL